MNIILISLFICLLCAFTILLDTSLPMLGWVCFVSLAMILLIGFITWKQKNFLLVCMLFCAYLVLAVVALNRGANAYLLVFGIGSALAAWDLALFAWRLSGQQPIVATKQYIWQHLRFLLIALLAGCLLAAAGLSVRFNLSFFIVSLLAVAILFALFKILTMVKNH
jgi:hypothetical protein